MSIGLEGFSYTLTLGRKRVVVSNNVEASPQGTNPLKRMCSSDRISLNSETSPLEALPQDILVQVLSGVDHEDLRQLFHVSKTIREASLIAKELHFEYRTPKKKTFYFLTPLDLEDANEFQEKEAPNAPLIKKPKSRFNRKKLEDIAVTLFPFIDEEQ